MSTSKKRNSLIELYRFLFAMNVVKGHSLMPATTHLFGPGRVSVEFFFVLSGYLFIRSLERWRELPMKKALGSMLGSKLMPLLIPTVIGLISNIAYNIVTKDYLSGIWGYLWYVHAMIVVFFFYVVLRVLVKSDKAFKYTVFGIFVLATVMQFSGIFYTWGYVRGASTISLGMLLSYLPKIKFKRQWPIWLMLIPVWAGTFSVVCFGLGNVEVLGGFRIVELLLDTVLYPLLVYLSFSVDFSFAPFNYLGALSFGLYAFQCPADLLRALGVSDRWLLFGVIVGLTVLDDTLKRLRKYFSNKKSITKEPERNKVCEIQN